MSALPEPRTWSPDTRRRWFYITLAGSALSVAWIFGPFLDVVLFAGVVAAVSSPVFNRLLALVGGRRIVAAVLTTALFALGVLLPLGIVLWRFALEGVEFATLAVEWVGAGHVEAALDRVQAEWDDPRFDLFRGLVGPGEEPTDLLVDSAKKVAVSAFTVLSGSLPALAEGIAKGVLDLLLFVFTVVTLLAEGPRLLRFILDLSPLEERYQRHLLGVFQEFATNMVVAAFVVACAQGTLATFGYWLFGVPRALFFGVLTGAVSFVPVIGTAVVALPVVVYVAWLHGWAAGLGLTLFAVLVVGTVDNVIRPLILRGNSKIHPLLIFFAVFGGLRWLGLAGVLVGPVLVAFFLALATIHRQETLAEAGPADG